MARRVGLAVLVVILLFSAGCTIVYGPSRGNVVGEVLDRNLDPVAGAWVTIGNHRERTNSSGYFEIRDIRPGTYEVWVRHPSLAADVTRTISVASGQTVTLLDDNALIGDRVTKPTYGAVQGYVYLARPLSSQSVGGNEVIFSATAMPDREPLANAKVTLYRDEYTAITEHDGWFYIPGVDPGEYTVEVTHPKLRTPATAEVTVYAGEVANLIGSNAVIGGIGYYIVVGINDYQYRDDIVPNKPNAGPAADAELIFETFASSTWAGYMRKLTNKAATRNNILNAVYDAVDAASSPDDYLVFYFSGITAQDWIVPYDDRRSGDLVITDWELERAFSAFPGEVIVILDGAQSGSMADGNPLRPGELSSNAFQPLALAKPKYTVLASSHTGESAVAEKEEPHYSVFTKWLAHGLKSREADGYEYPFKRDGVITDEELYWYVYDVMVTKKVPHEPYLYKDEHRPPVPIYRYK